MILPNAATDKSATKLSVKNTAKLFLVISIMEGDHPFFRFETEFFPSLFPAGHK
jgi:hypothetical protein